jgi:hypothetical protein
LQAIQTRFAFEFTQFQKKFLCSKGKKELKRKENNNDSEKESQTGDCLSQKRKEEFVVWDSKTTSSIIIICSLCRQKTKTRRKRKDFSLHARAKSI